MTDERCRHELPAPMCAECRPPARSLLLVLPPAIPPRRKAPTRPPREPGRYRLPDGVTVLERPRPGWVVALTPGTCMGCKCPFTAGVHIWFDETTAGRIAECCGEQERLP